jgi:protease-4
MDYRDKQKEEKEAPKRHFDTIVKAVATGIFILSIFLNLVFVVLIIILGSALGAAKYGEKEEVGYKKVYSETWYAEKGTRNELAVIRIQGIISEQDRERRLLEYTEDPVSGVKNRLDIIKKDKNIRGVLLVIESPGGTATASDILLQTILKFKEETGLPVVTVAKQVAASGAYYIAAATDYIVAYPTTIVGSIGVIMYNFNITGLMDKYGVEYIAIKTGKYKDLMSPFKETDREEISWMQDIVDQMLEQFIDVVASGRTNLTRNKIMNFADGRVYIAQDALEAGLIDEIGYFEDAVNILAERAGVEEPAIIELQKERNLKDIFSWALINIQPKSLADIVNYNEQKNPYGMYFLWDGVLTSR